MATETLQFNFKQQLLQQEQQFKATTVLLPSKVVYIPRFSNPTNPCIVACMVQWNFQGCQNQHQCDNIVGIVITVSPVAGLELLQVDSK